MNEEAAKALRAPFPPEAIGKLPRAGTQLDYVGHGAVTDRLLQVDPDWFWEPMAMDAEGTPLIRYRGKDAVLWIRLTVADTTRFGVGIVSADAFELEKQLISDALRNAAMRFGVALDLWSKEIILPPAEPVAAKKDVDLFKSCVNELDDALRIPFLRWKNDQGFEWPWTVAALGAMEAKLEEIVGAGDALTSEAQAFPASDEPVGESDKPAPPGSDAAASPALSDADSFSDTYDISEYSDAPF